MSNSWRPYKRATWYVNKDCSTNYNPSHMIKDLRCQDLKQHRVHTKLMVIYIMTNSLIDIPPGVPLNPKNWNTRGHPPRYTIHGFTGRMPTDALLSIQHQILWSISNNSGHRKVAWAFKDRTCGITKIARKHKQLWQLLICTQSSFPCTCTPRQIVIILQ